MNEVIMKVVEKHFKEHYPDMAIEYSDSTYFDRHCWQISRWEKPRYRCKFVIIREVKDKTYFWVHNLKKSNVIKNQLTLLGLEERKYI